MGLTLVFLGLTVTFLISLFGGRGTIYGALLGALLLTMLNNALVIAGVEFFWQLVAVGFIVICAVTINNVRENRIGWINRLRGRRAATMNRRADPAARAGIHMGLARRVPLAATAATAVAAGSGAAAQEEPIEIAYLSPPFDISDAWERVYWAVRERLDELTLVAV